MAIRNLSELIMHINYRLAYVNGFTYGNVLISQKLNPRVFVTSFFSQATEKVVFLELVDF